MSWMELKVINKDGDVLTAEEYKNAWGGAAFIWDALCKRYDVKDKYGYHSFDAWNILWNKVRDKEINLRPFEHNVLYFTYDNALVRKEDMELLAKSLRLFDEEHKYQFRVNHCLAIADTIDKYTNDNDVCGLGLYATSVGDDPWTEFNEKDKYNYYNINKGDKHWFIEMIQF